MMQWSTCREIEARVSSHALRKIAQASVATEVVLRLATAGVIALLTVAGCQPSVHVDDVTVRVSPQPLDVHMAASGVTGTLAVDFPADAKVALIPPDAIRLAAPDPPLKAEVSGTVGVDWPGDVKLGLIPPEAIRLAPPADPLRAEVTLKGPDAIRLEAPPNGLRTRLEPDGVLIARLKLDDALDKPLLGNIVRTVGRYGNGIKEPRCRLKR